MLERFETPRIADLHKDREHIDNVLKQYFDKYSHLEVKLDKNMDQKVSTPKDKYNYQEFYFLIQDLLGNLNPLPDFEEFTELKDESLNMVLEEECIPSPRSQGNSKCKTGSKARLRLFAQLICVTWVNQEKRKKVEHIANALALNSSMFICAV
jgi:hypothetical protein